MKFGSQAFDRVPVGLMNQCFLASVCRFISSSIVNHRMGGISALIRYSSRPDTPEILVVDVRLSYRSFKIGGINSIASDGLRKPTSAGAVAYSLYIVGLAS